MLCSIQTWAVGVVPSTPEIQFKPGMVRKRLWPQELGLHLGFFNVTSGHSRMVMAVGKFGDQGLFPFLMMFLFLDGVQLAVPSYLFLPFTHIQ